MTLPHHDAAHRDQRSRREAEFLGPEHAGDNHVAPRLQLAICLQLHAAAEVVEHEGLMRFRDPEFPGEPRMLDGSQGRSARASVVTRDQDLVGMSLRDPRRDRSHADFRHQLHTDFRGRIRVLEIEDQLRQVFDGINVVVRGWADQADAWGRHPGRGDHAIHLVTRKFAAFTRLGPLGDFDLDFVGIGEIPARDSEATARDLLDRRPLRVHVGHRLAIAAEPFRRFLDRLMPPKVEFHGRKPLVVFAPSPVLLLPPRTFIATAIVSCASFEIEP